MDTAKCEALITAVYKRPGLYDKSNKLYANRQYAAEAWKEISRETKIEENLAKKKWGNLRDYFRAQHRELTTGQSGSAPSKKRKWVFYESMTFLTQHMADRSAYSNLSAQDTDTHSSSDDDDSQEASCCNFSHGPSQPGASPIPTAKSEAMSQASCSSSKKKTTLAIKQERANVDSEIPDSKKGQEDEDEDYLFFKNLVPKMKYLSDIQKLELQAEINAVFLKHLKRAMNPDANLPTRTARLL